MLLKDKITLVTGGGRGIGREVSLCFAREGSDIALLDVLPEAMVETAADIKKLGRKVETFSADVTSLSQIEDTVNKILDKFTRIDILVNNAGITRDNLLMRMSSEEWETVLKVNLTGSFNCTKAVLRPMIKAKQGRIINIASIIGLMGNAGQGNYAASKAGMIGLTKSCAKEVASRGITVNAIAPGFIKTAMTDKLTDDLKAKMLELIPLKALGEAEDVANVALFLSSELARYITGQVVQVDGGMLM